MTTDIPNRAQPPLDFLPPQFDPKVLWGTKTLLPPWMHWRGSVKQLDVRGAEVLANLFHEFYAGKVRFLIAFRHPSPDDAYCLMNLLWNELPKVARQMGRPLQKTPHVHFIYDRGIPLWAGEGVGWFYSKLGGTSIQRGKVDRQGLKSARGLFAEGKFPMAAAPEGGNNGHSEIVSPFEPGIAQFGFWCVEDLLKANRTETVYLVPLGIRYFYRSPPWDGLAKLITEMEQELGLTLPTESKSSVHEVSVQALYPRLVRLGHRLLEVMETYYANFFNIVFNDNLINKETRDNEFSSRLSNLLDKALYVAESFFYIQPKGSMIDRCRKIEQAGWDWIYREDLRDQSSLSPIEKGLADRIAEEADLRMWHMRLVENFVAVTGNYVAEKPTVERFSETLLLLRDTVVRIEGKNPFPRPTLGTQVAHLSVGNPISVSDRWEAYKGNRRQAVATLTEDLQMATQDLITSETSDESL
jgi:hypothetical protein